MSPHIKLRRVTREELNGWWSGSDSEVEDALPQRIDEPWPYMFQPGDSVWIRTAGGNWHRGRVSAQTARKGVISRQGFFYSVVFNERLRKYFAPLNGDIKPDSRHTRELLEGAGVL
ncbi:hypothetical protein CPB85DRAFT_1229335 [Mucidula mucida]|nr:hypothetical protein CPB85DRAFT_1229335 [Mucidula mucida]